MKLFKYLSFIFSCLVICVGASYATQCSYEGNITTCKLNYPIYKQIQFDTEKRQVSVKAYCGHQYIVPKENITFPQIEGEFWTDAQHLAQFFSNYAWVQIQYIQSHKKIKPQMAVIVHLKQKDGMYSEHKPWCSDPTMPHDKCHKAGCGRMHPEMEGCHKDFCYRMHPEMEDCHRNGCNRMHAPMEECHLDHI